MIITCFQCSTQYYLANQALAPSGKRVKCSKCSIIWFQDYVAIPKVEFNKANVESFNVKDNKIFLPAVVKKKLFIWKPTLIIILFLIIFGLAALFFQEDLSIKYSNISSVYDKLGIPAVSGMKIRTVEISGKDSNNYIDINAVIENNSKSYKRVPPVVVFLFDEDHTLFKTIFIPAPPKYLNKGSKYAFYRKIEHGSKIRPRVVSLTLMNGIEVFFHSLNFK